jgi:hypothetical protein
VRIPDKKNGDAVYHFDKLLVCSLSKLLNISSNTLTKLTEILDDRDLRFERRLNKLSELPALSTSHPVPAPKFKEHQSSNVSDKDQGDACDDNPDKTIT